MHCVADRTSGSVAATFSCSGRLASTVPSCNGSAATATSKAALKSGATNMSISHPDEREPYRDCSGWVNQFINCLGNCGSQPNPCYNYLNCQPERCHDFVQGAVDRAHVHFSRRRTRRRCSKSER